MVKIGIDVERRDLPPPNTVVKIEKRRLRIHRVLSYLALFSTAVTLSTILPTPWSFLSTETSRVALRKKVAADPASEWQDNVWPLRPQTPWDISTDFPYPRKLEYDVQEGTWLRLDVHPKSGDIVFDMVGDIYCLPGHQAMKTGATTKARPVLTGVPFDSDPHFSPDGDRLVFRSDAELGVENIWITEWKGCEAMDVRPDGAVNQALRVALKEKTVEEDMLAKGIPEAPQRKINRLVREGRLEGVYLCLKHSICSHFLSAQRVTNETYRWVSDARFHPSGSKVIATKWYTSDRSLGAGEGWEYSVPSLESLRETPKTIEVGSGTRLLGRSLPAGWTSEDYGEVQIGPEQFIWNGNDGIIYSKNVADDPSSFTYGKG